MKHWLGLLAHWLGLPLHHHVHMWLGCLTLNQNEEHRKACRCGNEVPILDPEWQGGQPILEWGSDREMHATTGQPCWVGGGVMLLPLFRANLSSTKKEHPVNRHMCIRCLANKEEPFPSCRRCMNLRCLCLIFSLSLYCGKNNDGKKRKKT